MVKLLDYKEGDPVLSLPSAKVVHWVIFGQLISLSLACLTSILARKVEKDNIIGLTSVKEVIVIAFIRIVKFMKNNNYS